MNDCDGFAINFDPDNSRPFCVPEIPMIEPPVLRIYLASPLTNADPETANDCRMIRSVTRRVLDNYDYMGIRFNVYDPAEVTPPGSEHTSEEVYLTDHNRTATADLVIFHVNCPSLGVGMEAQIAAGATVPRVVVSKKGARISRMFLGVCSPTIANIQYTNEVDFAAELSTQLPEIARLACKSAVRRRQFVRELRESAMGRRIFKQRILEGITIDQLASQADIAECFLRRLERDPELAANVTQIQLRRIVSTINCTASVTASGMTKLSVSDSELATCQRQSLDNLIEFVVAQPEWLPDERIFRVWQEYALDADEELTDAIRHRSRPEGTAVTSEEWRQRYAALGLY